MNKSVDERLIPPGEYVDALNVRLGSTETTEIGAVENSLGNSLLTNLQFAGQDLVGDVKCIGVFEDGINETLYWFVHNENNPYSSDTGVVDLVVSYNTNSGILIYHCISTSVLNFNFTYLITGVSKIEDLLFFTDDLNPPRCINVTRDYAYPGPGQIDNRFVEEDVSVIVKPPGFEDRLVDGGGNYFTSMPLSSPHVELSLIEGGEQNYIKTRFLTFAYRYRYEDGEYSATSLFSTPAFEPGTFVLSNQNYWNGGMENRYNRCMVTFSTGSRRVKEIDLLYKETTSNVIYVVNRFKKADLEISDNDFFTYEFINSEIYTTLGSDELLRLYDNVPRRAKAQTIQGNRLMYGNYVDGYNITRTEEGQVIPVEYRAEPFSSLINGDEFPIPTVSSGSYTIGGAVSEANSRITWDLAAMQSGGSTVIEAGTIIDFTFQLQQTTPTVCTDSGTSAQCVNTSLQSSPFYVSMSFVAAVDYADVNAMLSSQEFKDRVGGSADQGFSGVSVVQEIYPCNNSADGATLSDQFYAAAEDPMIGSTLQLVGGGVTNTACSVSALNTNPFPTPCATDSITEGTTDNTTVTAGEMEDTSIDFAAAGVVVGDIVIDRLTGLSAEVTAVPGGGGANTLTIIDINGGLATLQVSGTLFKIVTGASSVPPCSHHGFRFINSGTTFTLQVPATQWFSADGTSSGNYAVAYRYYNFVAFNSSGGFKLSSESGSLHSNRDYEVGVMYMDAEGRSSTVITSNDSTLYFQPSTSILKNKIRVTLDSLPPYWASKYKFVVKPSQGTYQTVFSTTFYQQNGTGSGGTGLPVATENDPSQVWFRLEGQNQNILQVGDELTVKQDTQGAVLTEQKSVVLAIQPFSGGGITSVSLAGLYMLLKPSGWSIETPENAYYFYGTRSDQSCVTYYSLNDSEGVPYTIPAGSTIRIKLWIRRNGGGDCSKRIEFDRTFISSNDYLDFRQWALGDDLRGQMRTGNCTNIIGGMTLAFQEELSPIDAVGNSNFGVVGNQVQVCNDSGFSDSGDALAAICENASGGLFFNLNNGGLVDCRRRGNHSPKVHLRIEVTRAIGTFTFETEPQEVDPNLFYDASELLDIESETPGGQKYHMAKRDFIPTNLQPNNYVLSAASQDQTSGGLSLITVLDDYNCYTFGNGVESFRIHDNPAGKTFNLGERTVAVSNQDFQEADRFAGITYSGVYSSSSNSNNLNEFNLGLVNFKDCETSFGPIQILHARQTDILTLQEDRISYVLAGKDIISDSAGGGAIISVPTVLNQQIARIEEFGISFNPESFVSWGYDMFFTDTKRGAVINLRGSNRKNDEVQVVSKLGMNSWFRDTFNAQLTTQKLGGYDPYMNEYVLGTNLRTVPVLENKIPCNQTLTQVDSNTIIEYEVVLGAIVGQVNIPYTITPGGSLSISVTWNGSVVASVSNATVSGFLTFAKSLNSQQTCFVTITPVAASYSITVDCLPKNPITVIQVVTNTNNYNNELIHTSYNWTDGFTVSPSAGFSSAELTVPQASEYQSNVGSRSLGVFPYNGVDIKLKTQKYGIDTFDFNPDIHKFRILSSNTLYEDTDADLSALLTASSLVGGGVITSPAPNEYQGVETGFSLPDFNQYLYLIWDLRLISSQIVCYCQTTDEANDVCCECEVACRNAYFGPRSNSVGMVCTTDVDSPGNLGTRSYNGNGGLPTIGDIVYNTNNCGLPTMQRGFYIVSPVTPSVLPKKWVQIDDTGTVISGGTC
jgi:hypothetical protein